MRVDDLNIIDGHVTHWALDVVELNKSTSEQYEELTEDLAQICFKNDIAVDIGWYPESSINGQFCIYLIKDKNWEEPIITIKFSLIELFVPSVNFAISIAKKF